MLRLLGFAALGLVYELGVTAYYRLVARGRAWPASVLTTGLTLFSLWVLDSVMGSGLAWPDGIAYALGNGAGCWALLNRKGSHAASRTK